MTVYTVTPDALVDDVATLMVTHGIGDAIVVEEGKPVGILTDRDLVTRVMAAGLNGTTLLARDIMSAPPVTVPPKRGSQHSHRAHEPSWHPSFTDHRRSGQTGVDPDPG